MSNEESTTQMSSKGHVMIPKTITAPSLDSFDILIRQARQQAQAAGFKRMDIAKAITKARGGK